MGDEPRRLPRPWTAALGGALSGVALLAGAGEGRAQGYDVRPETPRVLQRGLGATRLDVDSVHPERAAQRIDLPFPFRFYGRRTTSVVVSAFGWILPGADGGIADPGDPSSPHGQDSKTGAFAYRGDAGPEAARADGVVAPLWTGFTAVNDGTDGAGSVWVWALGEAPRRFFVVSWNDVGAGALGRVTVQIHLQEDRDRIHFAYAPGAVTGGDLPPPTCVVGIDERGGARFTAPADAAGAPTLGLPSSGYVLAPRIALANVPDAARQGEFATWSDERSTSLSGEAGAKSCSYLGKGDVWLFVPDRVTRGKPTRLAELCAEDLAAFPPSPGRTPYRPDGDPVRWVRQILDGKVILVPQEPGPAVRLWFRVVEYFTIDDRGMAGKDEHVWNLRILLSLALPDGDPRADISRYSAWRAMASARLDVGKLFAANQPDDAGRQFDTGRDVEYVQWCARLRVGTRGAMPEADCPADGWVRFPMKKPDETDEQHADKGDLRWVPDPNYVPSGYEYVVRSADAPDGWICRVRNRPRTVTDEAFEHDP